MQHRLLHATVNLVNDAMYLLPCRIQSVNELRARRLRFKEIRRTMPTVLKKGPGRTNRKATDTKPKEPPRKAKQEAFHVLLRVRSELGQTITAHKNIVARKGTAVLGKMGGALGPAFRLALNEQIERGIKTYLFLTTREGWNGPYVTDRCSLLHVYDALDTSKRALVPAYYASDSATIRTWFEIASVERLTRDEMNRIFVLSSGREIMSVIASSATVFKVAVKPKQAIRP